MSDVHAVLLVPASGDTQLLASGVCGARPPTAAESPVAGTAKCPDCGRRARYSAAPTEQTDSLYVCDECDTSVSAHSLAWCDVAWRPGSTRYRFEGRRALVLAWDGEPVVEGLDRLRNRGGWSDGLLRVALLLGKDYRACNVTPPDLGTIVLLDAEGREVTP